MRAAARQRETTRNRSRGGICKRLHFERARIREKPKEKEEEKEEEEEEEEDDDDEEEQEDEYEDGLLLPLAKRFLKYRARNNTFFSYKQDAFIVKLKKSYDMLEWNFFVRYKIRGVHI